MLQVHPEAESEVIEAAYRQLMRKYHPDVGGDDPASAARLHERAKAINQAYAVLRDPFQRHIYDGMRQGLRAGRRAPPPPPPPRPPSATPAASAWQTARPAEEEVSAAAEATALAWWPRLLTAPIAVLSSAYFLLPGAYEWEPASEREVVQALAIPPLGILSWLTATGRLDPWLGHSLLGTVGIWAVVGVVALLAVGSALPRVALIGGATLMLLSGALDPGLRSAGVPLWFGWCGLGLVSLVIAARVFLFGVLPTLGVCWLIGSVL